MKDHLFNAETVTVLGRHFDDAGVFDAQPFVDDVMAGLAPLELKARINWIAEVLAGYLPHEFDAAAQAISSALPPPLDPTKSDDDFGHFIYAPLGVYVETHGLHAHVDQSLSLLEQLTQRFSMEFSIRAFLNSFEDQTLERMQDWVLHENYHVRRLVSEGTRPKLPWGTKVGLTPDQTLPLLDQLHADPTRFVTRSVANHLNDITKSDGTAVIGRLEAWQSQRAQVPKELDWMRKHALRGLIKAGDPNAMLHLGYRPDVAIHLTHFAITPNEVEIGGDAEISMEIKCDHDAPVIVDYRIDFAKPSGGTSTKVFKCKQLELKAGKPVTITKRHKFKGDATTFTLHPGVHCLHCQINGRVIHSVEFHLR
ncbi:hypothetical protein [Loktanella sp. S4079]|uniref:hypothetical protein n=1 Tax=Loktanella sp. S4079 TaxID=579483 RepID=UPI00315A25C8